MLCSGNGNKRDKQCFLFIPQHGAEVCPRFSRKWPFIGKGVGYVRRAPLRHVRRCQVPYRGTFGTAYRTGCASSGIRRPSETERCHAPQALRGIQPMGIRRVTVTRISASCCGGTCFRQKPLDIATRCTSTLRVTGLR